MNRDTFLESFGHIADAPGGIDRLRSMILDLAVRGELVPHETDDEPASDFLARVRDERVGSGGEVRTGRRRALNHKEGAEGSGPPAPPPPGWAWSTLGNLFAMQAGKNIPAGAIRESGSYPCYGGNGIRGYVETFNRDGSFPIIGRQGALCGNVNLAEGQFFATEHAVVVETFAGTSVAWATLALAGLNLNQYATATAQPGLSVARISTVAIAVPPLAEQARIVERVAELTKLCNELEQQQAACMEARRALAVSTLNRVSEAESAHDFRSAIRALADTIDLHLAPGEGDLAALAQVRQAIVDLAVSGHLTRQDSTEESTRGLIRRIAAARDHLVKTGAIRKPKPVMALSEQDVPFAVPRGWSWCRLGDLLVAPLSNGRSVPTREDGFPVLRLTAMRGDIIDLGERKGGDWAERQARPYLVGGGDILVARGNGSLSLVGRASRVVDPIGPVQVAYPDTMIRIQPPRDAIDSAYLTLLWNSRLVRTQLELKARTTAGIYKVSQDDLRDVVLAIPPFEEQRRIVRSLARLTTLCDELEAQLTAAREVRGVLAASVAAHVAGEPSTS